MIWYRACTFGVYRQYSWYRSRTLVSYSKVKVGKKKSTHLDPVSLFLRPGSFVLYWSQGDNQKVAYSLWSGIPVTVQEAVQPCWGRLMKRLGSDASGLAHVTWFHSSMWLPAISHTRTFLLLNENSLQSGRICIPHGERVEGLGGWHPFRFFLILLHAHPTSTPTSTRNALMSYSVVHCALTECF